VSGGDHRWFKRSTGKKRPVSKDIHIVLLLLLLFAAIGLSGGGSVYFTCIQNKKLVTTKFESGRLHVNHVVATWNLGNHLSICF